MSCCSQLQSLGVIDSIEGLFCIKKYFNGFFLVNMGISLKEWECLVLETVEGWVYCVYGIIVRCKIYVGLVGWLLRRSSSDSQLR